MELNEITMPRAKARAAFIDYRQAVRARHNREDEQIMRGYKALANGLRVINLRETIVAGGEDVLHRPQLAVARADAKSCWMRRHENGSVEFMSDSADFWYALHGRRVQFPAGTLPAVEKLGLTKWDHRTQGVAFVPNIPPRLRPVHALTGYHVLFQAEWKPVAPRDPVLLKHLGGELWAVLAVWDLTDLERAVLAGRATASRSRSRAPTVSSRSTG